MTSLLRSRAERPGRSTERPVTGPHRRSPGRSLAVWSVLLAGLLGWPAVVSGGEAPGPALELEPAGPFEDGEAFVLEASGFEPGADLAAAVCAAEARNDSDSSGSEVPTADLQLCDQQFRFEQADAEGDAEFAFVARRMLRTPGGVYNCSVEGQGCIVGAASIADFAPVSIPLPMEPVASSAPPEVTVDSVSRADGAAEVAITVSGAPPDTATDAVACGASGDGFDRAMCSEATFIEIGASGQGSTTVPLGWLSPREITSPSGGLVPVGEPVDCAGPGMPCVLVVGRYTGSPVIVRIPMGSSPTG